MKKLQKLLSMGIAMTMLLVAMTGCSVEKIEDTPSNVTSDTSSNTSSETVEDTPQIEVEQQPPEVVTLEIPEDFDQLAPPEVGDTVATISIAGFGEVKIKFFPEQAPLAVENFTTHASNGYYDGIIFHRVIDGFMIQGGDPDGNGTGGESIWGEPFVNEDSTDLYHYNGALSMANAGPDTNGSQFFIVNSPQVLPNLDANGGIVEDEMYPMFMSTLRGYSSYAHKVYTSIGGASNLDGGYTVFGQVYEGMDVVEAIMQVETTGNERSTPVEDVVIESIIVSEYQ